MLPQSTLLPHRTLLPQRTFEPQSTLLPHTASDPHRTLLPQRTLLPEVVVLLDIALLVDDVPVTNCEDPHTVVFDQVDDVFQTAEGSSVMVTWLVDELKVAIGDMAVPRAKLVSAMAASMST